MLQSGLENQIYSKKLPIRRFLLKETGGSAQNWDLAWANLTNFILEETHFKIAAPSLYLYFHNHEQKCYLAREVVGVPTSYMTSNSEEIFLRDYESELLYRFDVSFSDLEDISVANIMGYCHKFQEKLQVNANLKDYWRLEINEKDLLWGNFGHKMCLSLDFFADLI